MFLTLYKAGFETNEFRKNCSPQSASGLPRSRVEPLPGLQEWAGCWGRNEEFRSCPKPLCSRRLGGQAWEPLLSSWETPEGLCCPRPLWFPRLFHHAELPILLLVSCSNGSIISRDVTLRRRDGNGAQRPSWETWGSQPPGVLCYLQNYVTW